MLKGKIVTLMLSGILATNISPIANTFTSVSYTDNSERTKSSFSEDTNVSESLAPDSSSNQIETSVDKTSDSSIEETTSSTVEQETEQTTEQTTETLTEETSSTVEQESKPQTKNIVGSQRISVVFPDPNFAAEIARIFNRTVSSTVTQAELNTINTIILENKVIGTIEGVQHLNNLAEFSLINSMNVTSLAPLQNGSMSKLKVIFLKNNQITDLTPLSHITSLERLYFENNKITSLKPISTLTNLTTLSFQNEDGLPQKNQIASLEGVESLHKLKIIYGKGNQLTTLENLLNLTTLEQVFVESNKLTNLKGLRNKPNLTDLSVMYQSVSDISDISTATNLRNLYIRTNKITTIESLASLTKLTLLYMENNQVRDISPLRGITTLTTFSATNQTILLDSVDYYPLKDFTIENVVRGRMNDLVTPLDISHSGTYQDGKIKWNLPSGTTLATYTWRTSANLPGTFSGTISQPLNEKEGQLFFNEAPTTIDFGMHKISSMTLNTFGQPVGNLKVTDERAAGSWKVQLKQTQPLMNNGYELSGVLSFVTAENTMAIGADAITVFESNQKGESDLSGLLDSQNQKGIKASIPVEDQRIGTFEGTLQWTLVDVP